MPVVTDYSALISGGSWSGIEVSGSPVIVTYSFPTSAPAYMAGISGFTAATVSSFQAFTAAAQAQARAAMAEWAAASGLIFIEVAPGMGDINFQNVDLDTTTYAGAGGVAFYPFGDWNGFTFPSFRGDLDSSGDVFMNSQFLSGGQVNYGTLLHEIGHAIGLKHPTEVVTNFATFPATVHDQVLSADDGNLTIMATGSGTAVLKQLDKDAAAYLYGTSGTGGVYTGSAAGANSVVSAWAWNATTSILTQTGFATDDVIRGSSVGDVINGLNGNDRLFGLAGNDRLNGGEGNDLLEGGVGNDVMTGGFGDDTYFIDGTDRVVELASGGYDSVYSKQSYTLTAEVEYLQLFGSGLTGRGNTAANSIFGDGSFTNTLYGLAGSDYIVGGNGADRLYGGSESDQLFGGGGNDTLSGDTGSDSMDGGDGSDTYMVDDVFDTVTESNAVLATGGSDLVKSSVDFTLSANVERLTLTGTGAINGTGNGLANTLTGNSAANQLSGLAGNDILDGGGGADTMIGGDGIDTYVVDNGLDVVTETNAVLATGGSDLVKASVDFTLSANLERLTLTGTGAINGTGNGLANTITGNSGANRLSGLAGNDTLTGGLGHDQFDFSTAFAAGSLGRDRIADFEGGAGAGDVIIIDDTWLTPLGITTTAQLAASFQISGADLKLTLDGLDTITLTGRAAMILSSDDFLIV